ncbi:MAG: hypothetical protein VX466_12960, partial [Myxococcota bacterium]|nr:hypothetical protein [Myxococcota bacterium]
MSRSVLVALLLTLASFAAQAHDTRLPIAADELEVKASGLGGPSYEFSFSAQEPILLNLDPRQNPTAVLVYGTGADAGSTGLLDLDPSLWTPEMGGMGITGYTYSDPTGAISSATLRQGELQVSGSTSAWPWSPAGAVDELWFWFLIEEEWFCAEADESNAFKVRNQAGWVSFQNTVAPSSCPDQVCGNGIREVGELCDDGNIIEGDGCSNDCQSDACTTADFDTTYEGIQSIIFDGYACNNAICHNPAAVPMAAGGLDLTAGASYDQLVNVASTIVSADGVTFLDRVEPSEPIASFLYEKLSAGTNATPTGGVAMPFLGAVLTPEHLEAVEKWIRAGAPEDLVVGETAGLLGTCLPPEDPLKTEPPAYPPAGEGIQFRSTAWELPANSEDEICYATYYDLAGLVPEEDQLDCPGFGSTNNPSGTCFSYTRRILLQDAQSHHSIIQLYNGTTSINDPGAFGDFTYKPNYPNEQGAPSGPCDPLQIDPTTGQHADCSGVTISGVACGNYETVVPDSSAQTLPTFAGSQ